MMRAVANGLESPPRIKAGIIGTGFIGPVHLEALLRLGVPVTALCDLPQRARTAAERYGIPEAFGDYRELLRFANGARGNLGVSQVAAGRKNCIPLEIYGSKKSAGWCSEELEMLHFGNRDDASATAVRATPAFGDGAAGFMDYPPGHVEGFPDTFKMLFRNIYAAIAGGKGERLFATANDGRQEVAVGEAVLKSNQSRSWVEV